MFINRRTVQSMRKKNTKLCLQRNPGDFEEKNYCVQFCPTRSEKKYFYSVSRYEQWDGSPFQTRNRNPQPGQNSGSQQQFFKHLRKRRKKKLKKTGQGETYQKKKKEIKYSSKEILIRLYFISFSSRLSQCCF